MLGENRPPAVSAQSASCALGDELPSKQRSRHTNDPLFGLHLNTARGRRAADLVRAYLKALGNPEDTGRQAAAIAAAEMQVLAEETRAAALLDPRAADLDNLVRVQSAADRSLRKLGIKAAAQKTRTLRETLMGGHP
jgi:hypothetical protein